MPRLFGPEIFELAGKRDIGFIGSFKNQAVAEIQHEDARFLTAESLVEAIDAAQLTGPDIPVPIRLFASDVSTLSIIALGILLYSWFFSQSTDLGTLDVMLPITGLLAVLFTRVFSRGAHVLSRPPKAE